MWGDAFDAKFASYKMCFPCPFFVVSWLEALVDRILRLVQELEENIENIENAFPR